jgi:hypothetical protein
MRGYQLYANLFVLKVKGPARLLELHRLSNLVHGNPKHISLLNFPEIYSV